MVINERKIIVCCPAGVVTGGTELLHQIVSELRRIGRDAYISYYPFGSDHTCPVAYRKYDVRQSVLTDDEDTFVLLPEVATQLVRSVKRARVGIWWLSVDNYFGGPYPTSLRKLYGRIRTLREGRIPVRLLKRHVHLSQSHYSMTFLKSYGIDSRMLGDYLGEEHFQRAQEVRLEQKENIVVYNPKKGLQKTEQLIAAFPKLKFVPIYNMTSEQVAELFASAKIYVDLGHHPGKDRPPREAAIAGCCVITGVQGSAKYYEDVPISESYKLDDNGRGYITQFGNLVHTIFDDFLGSHRDFANYREVIRNEPQDFKRQAKQIFGQDI